MQTNILYLNYTYRLDKNPIHKNEKLKLNNIFFNTVKQMKPFAFQKYFK